MGDQWLSDSMVVYIERDAFAFINNEPIMRRFHDMKPCRQQLGEGPSLILCSFATAQMETRRKKKETKML
ncbi:hypothetical protein DVH24_019413 [Malus domestica]|uniref:Uncharacterized protein n=1 Tax=Malus domestica TaxID=3750 RepID=A0A498I3A7_MALDO|nr:hypothetical protein DVH24_019413 [Malus domestica]